MNKRHKKREKEKEKNKNKKCSENRAQKNHIT